MATIAFNSTVYAKSLASGLSRSNSKNIPKLAPLKHHPDREMVSENSTFICSNTATDFQRLTYQSVRPPHGCVKLGNNHDSILHAKLKTTKTSTLGALACQSRGIEEMHWWLTRTKKYRENNQPRTTIVRSQERKGESGPRRRRINIASKLPDCLAVVHEWRWNGREQFCFRMGSARSFERMDQWIGEMNPSRYSAQDCVWVRPRCGGGRAWAGTRLGFKDCVGGPCLAMLTVCYHGWSDVASQRDVVNLSNWSLRDLPKAAARLT
jgi:hypothetical protein